MHGFHNTHPMATGYLPEGRVFKLAGNGLRRIKAWNRGRATENTLNKLSPHELDDIGLVPGDIDRIVRKTR